MYTIAMFQGGHRWDVNRLSRIVATLFENGLHVPNKLSSTDGFFDVTLYLVQYQGTCYNITVISYLADISRFDFDEKSRTISWQMPFDWASLSVSNSTNFFVHQDVRVPKSLMIFDNVTYQNSATVNSIPISGTMLAIDPYSSNNDVIFHYLIAKNNLINMSKVIADKNTIIFTLAPTATVPEFGISATVIASEAILGTIAVLWRYSRKLRT